MSSVEVRDRAGVSAPVFANVENATHVYQVLTGLAALVGLFGVVNVVSLSIVERRRELGLLRAVGMDRRQLRSMLRAETLIIAVLGAAGGIAIGTGFGWALARVVGHATWPIRFTVPVGTLGVVAVLTALAALAAAALPARLAGRVDMLRAIASE
jgi:putative ABC transport system permease protein